MEIQKAYEPQSVEDKWYAYWQERGCFIADPARVTEKRPAYSIVIPPPNVTGMLHMGHVLNATIQDILSRKARMDGKEVLWLPGTDHAGIGTQVQVEKALKKEEKKSRHDIGREEFLKRVWQWKEKHGGIIIQQLKKLGCSCDWTRERFTMDPEYSRCVQKVFVELYKKGLIYRGKRMVNWCPASQTALSDEEVEMKPQKGLMYCFKVEVAEAPGTWLTIATTRPETIPGDTAVAVNPKDPRYAHLIGKHIVRPLPAELPREQKLIPIIEDDHVDFEFGTGVLKVTPAHDKADFEIGQRHKLPLIDIMNPDATMNSLAGGPLVGLDRFKARKVAVELLREQGVLVEEKPYENNVGFSQRADVPIEPRLSEQWFLKYPAVKQSKACVEQEGSTGHRPVPSGDSPDGMGTSVGMQSTSGASKLLPSIPVGGSPTGTGGSPVPPAEKMRFHPQRWAKVYDHWLANIQDWCISRQLWWGHRIPVWSVICEGPKTTEVFHTLDQCLADSLEDVLELKGDESAIRIINPETGELLHPTVLQFNHGLEGIRVQIHVALVNEAIGAALERNGFTQDPDVLDTWFSSWLWPFATMGWPEQTETLQKFYPTTDLVTGPDIIFFWVARMIMAGYEFMGEMPFRNVYFTGIIRDKQGRKMSKSLGNSPDPLELIAKYGADALRFGTMRSAPLGQDVLFDEKDVELGRNFCNKLWNACRFRQMQEVPGVQAEIEGEINPALLTAEDKWVLLKLDKAIREMDAAFTEYKFNDATSTLYRFFWSEYCDWYVEASKAVLGSMRVSSDSSGGGQESSSVNSKPEQQASGGVPGAATGAVALPAEFQARRANKLAVMDFVLSHTLRLFHPFMPFITEELWHGLGYNSDLPSGQGGETILFSHWPRPLDERFKTHYGLDDSDEQLVTAKFELVTQGRNLRREGNVPSSKKVKFIFKPAGAVSAGDAAVLKILLNAESLEIDSGYKPATGTPATRSALGELFLPLEGVRDVDAERTRLLKEIAKIDAEIQKVEQKLANPAFTQKVPAAVLEDHQKRLVEWRARRAQAQAARDGLG